MKMQTTAFIMTARYDEAMAKLSWDRTLAHFREHLI